MADTAVHLPSINGSQPTPPKGAKSVPENQIYEGHKFYWKQRLNVDLNFLYHKENQTYEIISYDTDKDVELQSLFLSEAVLLPLVQAEVDEAVAKIKQEHARDRFKQALPAAEIHAKAKKSVVTQFILNRLVAFVENGSPGLRLNPLSVDNAAAFEDLVVVESAPANEDGRITEENGVVAGTSDGTNGAAAVSAAAAGGEEAGGKAVAGGSKQTKINRRRRTTSADFDNALKDLRQNSQELDKSLNQASRLTELSRKSVDAFKDALLMNVGGGSRIIDKSTPLGMFKWVAHRVILQNTVQRVREDLDAREHTKGIHINATFPNPDGSIGPKTTQTTSQMNRVPHLAALAEGHSREGSPFTSPRNPTDDMAVSNKRADRMAAANSTKSLQKSQSGSATGADHLPPVNGSAKKK